MSESNLILPGRQQRKTRRGGDFATLDEALNLAMNTAGPIAVTLQELMVKVARIEDRLGITDESIEGETPPVGTPITPPFTVGPQLSSVATVGGDVE